MTIVVEVPFQYDLRAVEVRGRIPWTIEVIDAMPVSLSECGTGDLPVAMTGPAYWMVDWKHGHEVTATRILADGETLLAVPETPTPDEPLPGVDALVWGYDCGSWQLRDHPFLRRDRDDIDIASLAIRSVVSSGREAAAAAVLDVTSRMRIAGGVLHVPVTEMAYAVSASRVRGGSYVSIAPVPHAEVVWDAQLFRADRLPEAQAYARWLAEESGICPGGTKVELLGEIDLLRPEHVRLDGMACARRHARIVMGSLKPCVMPDDASDAHAAFWAASRAGDPLALDTAVMALRDATTGMKADMSSLGRIARIAREYAGRLALTGPGSGALPEDDEAALSELV